MNWAEGQCMKWYVKGRGDIQRKGGVIWTIVIMLAFVKNLMSVIYFPKVAHGL